MVREMGFELIVYCLSFVQLIRMSWLQAKGKIDNWQNTESWKLLKMFAKSGTVFTPSEVFLQSENSLLKGGCGED